MFLYCSSAAVPIFIGSYMDPTDTKELSFSGTVRLVKPCPATPVSQDIHDLYDTLEDPGTPRNEKSEGVTSVFNISDPSDNATGPSAKHRAHRLLLPSPDSVSSELQLQQYNEREQKGYVSSYPKGYFRDGDLVVFNYDSRAWEHYEHVQLRRRFAAVHARKFTQANNNNSSGKDVDSNAEEEDTSMAARRLCTSLDFLLLSWTKWVIDNRFYENRHDAGWLYCAEPEDTKSRRRGKQAKKDAAASTSAAPPQQQPQSLVFVGRYVIWSFQLNNLRFFYGVIPKFVKEKVRRQRIAQKKRNEKLELRRQVKEQQHESATNEKDNKMKQKQAAVDNNNSSNSNEETAAVVQTTLLHMERTSTYSSSINSDGASSKHQNQQQHQNQNQHQHQHQQLTPTIHTAGSSNSSMQQFKLQQKQQASYCSSSWSMRTTSRRGIMITLPNNESHDTTFDNVINNNNNSGSSHMIVGNANQSWLVSAQAGGYSAGGNGAMAHTPQPTATPNGSGGAGFHPVYYNGPMPAAPSAITVIQPMPSQSYHSHAMHENRYAPSMVATTTTTTTYGDGHTRFLRSYYASPHQQHHHSAPPPLYANGMGLGNNNNNNMLPAGEAMPQPMYGPGYVQQQQQQQAHPVPQPYPAPRPSSNSQHQQ